MEKKQIIIKGNFKGLLPNFTKNFTLIIVSICLILIGNALINSLLLGNSDLNLFEHILESLTSTNRVFNFLFVILLFMLSIILIVYSIINTISLLYEFSRITIFDFEKNTISVKYLYFPFIKIEELHILSSLCEISICITGFQKMFQCGDLYIEFFPHNNETKQTKKLYIPYIYNVTKLKNVLASKL